MTTTTIDTEQIKQNIDLRELAGRYSVLRKETAVELSGPCPKCGGDDRFHVQPAWFFCRQCHTKHGDAISFIRWLHGCTFREAVQMLSGAASMPVPATATKPHKTPTAQRKPFNRAAAWDIVGTASERLQFGSDGEPGRAYLAGRGLGPTTWERFSLGYRAGVPVPGTRGRVRAAAVVMPWIVGGDIAGIRYRFIDPQCGKKQTAERGSSFAGRLYGGHTLERDIDPADRIMVLCEGELNAASIWAAVAGRVDVLSLGSESAKLSPAAVQALKPYKRLIVWADREQVAKNLQRVLPGPYTLKSPAGQDANDLLQAGVLRNFLYLAIDRATK